MQKQLKPDEFVPNTVIWNCMNAKKRKTKGKCFKLPSLTVPDQALTIKQMLERFARGLPISNGKTPLYGSETGVNTKTLDFVDMQAIAMEAGEKVKGHNKGKAKAEAKQKEESIEAEVKRRLQEQADKGGQSPEGHL